MNLIKQGSNTDTHNITVTLQHADKKAFAKNSNVLMTHREDICNDFQELIQVFSSTSFLSKDFPRLEIMKKNSRLSMTCRNPAFIVYSHQSLAAVNN